MHTDLPYTTLCTIDGLAGDGGSGADISDFIKTRFEAVTDMTESYWMTLSAMTPPFVATVKGGNEGALLILSFGELRVVHNEIFHMHTNTHTMCPLQAVNPYIKGHLSIKDTCFCTVPIH